MKTMILTALVLVLGGCASLCDPSDKQCQHDTKEDAADIGAALDIIGAFDTPETTTTTKTCTKDRRGEETCTSTQQTNP